MIRIEHLSKSYGKLQVLNDINLVFEEGKTYGIVGENGAGKTTLFKCIAGIEKYEGIITADIMPVKDHTGFLQTEPYFLPRITGREYIQLLCNARNTKPGDVDAKNIFNLPLDKYAMGYSTGMKKKLAFFAIMLQENRYFILDEPFNGVDIEGNIIIMEILRELKRLEKTVIIASHIFSTLSDSCDQIHLLSESSISRSVSKDSFSMLETEMKEKTIRQHIGRLGLR